MPNRIIKESICTSDSIDSLSWFEEVLFYRLIVNCDDFGRYDGRAAIIKNRLFPLHEDDLTLDTVETALESLADADLITMYEHNGRPYLYLNTWDDHQRIRAKKSKYPSPDSNPLSNDRKLLSNDRNPLSNASVIQSNPIQSESNTNTKEGVTRKRFTPPSLEEVRAYCESRQNGVDPQAFIDFYTSKGWKIGRETMKDWQAAVRTWERREEKPRKQYTTAAQYKPPTKIDANNLEMIKRDFGL